MGAEKKERDEDREISLLSIIWLENVNSSHCQGEKGQNQSIQCSLAEQHLKLHIDSVKRLKDLWIGCISTSLMPHSELPERLKYRGGYLGEFEWKLF